jgi:exportin-5
MNGGLDGTYDGYGASPASSSHLGEISQALSATLDPRVSNEIRQQALQFLEQVKTEHDAPQYGFTLAEDYNQNTAVRYYGLQLLEYAVKYRWTKYSSKQAEQLRFWVKCLAGSIRQQDELYIRNKIAQLWVEVAKRCWGEEWMDMDKLLVTLWEKSVEEKGFANKIFVLYVLEMLSDDICNREDASAGLRLEVLGSALNEIIIPQALYEEHLTSRGKGAEVRAGREGWLSRVCEFFGQCVKNIRMGGDPAMVKNMEGAAGKALNALRPTMAWVSLKAVLEINCIDCLYLPFHTSDTLLQTAAVEVMYALLSRPYNAHFHEQWLTLINQSLQPERIAMFQQAYTRTGPELREDDEMHTLQKKMSEVLSIMADAVAGHPQLAHNGLDVNLLFNLLTGVLQSESLIVSIPVLHSWTKLLAVQDTAIIDLVMQALGVLLQTCSARLLNYEALPEDLEDPILQFLYEDFDTMPERHAFLGNYRRYCINVIETISRQRPLEALEHVLTQTKTLLNEGPYTGGRGFDPATFSKTSLPLLQFDAQFSVVVSVIKGFSRWEADTSAISHDDPLRARADADRATAHEMQQQWCYAIINTHVDDPEVASQILTLLSTILRTVKPGSEFVLHVVQHMLTMRLYDDPSHTTFSDAVKNFEALRVIELQKVALTFANELLEVFQELESRVNVLVEKHAADQRTVWGYRSFLFMIVHRATGVDAEARQARLQQMVSPVYESWQDPSLAASVSSFHGFCDTLALGGLDQFYKQYRFAEVQDWASQQLDEAGQARQTEIKSRLDRLPLRMTKSLLAATTEKLKEGSDEHDTACALWGPVIPAILPSLLQMIRHSQAFNNMANWAHLPEELQAVIKRTMQDRFWQSGISNESRDEFYKRISGSKNSYEGFASNVRGTVRNVREQGYHILYLSTRFEEQFYGLTDLAEPLAQALFEDAEHLATNHLNALINLTTGLVQRCPPHYRASFLPPVLTRLFIKLDLKISREWATISQVSQQTAEDDNLSEEMRKESVLRQLTYSTVSFVAFLFEHEKPPPRQSNGRGNSHSPSNAAPKPTLHDLVLSDASVLEPLILFCTHALRMQDSRCCTTVCKLFASLVPQFTSADPQVREFIASDVLKACITSLNEPYFADMQRDLASLIAQILSLYCPLTATPRNILLSLPDMEEGRVDRDVRKIVDASSARGQRALVLEMLKGVRGVSIYEAGKIEREAVQKKSARSGVQAQYMEVEQQRAGVTDGAEVGLEDVGGLFGDA